MRKQRGICSIEGCGRPHFARTWCLVHYTRWRERGTLETKLRKAGTGSFSRGYHTLSVGGVQKAIHVRMAEAALGKKLPYNTVVHHVNENKADNRPENLVICTQAYHRLIHQRLSAYKACGHYDWRICRFCKKHDNPANLSIIPGARPGRNATIYHRECARVNASRRYYARKAAA